MVGSIFDVVHWGRCAGVFAACSTLAFGCAGKDDPNGEPTAEADEYVLAPGAATLAVAAGAGVLTNDEDPDEHALEVDAKTVESLHGGAVKLDGDGGFTYTPRPGTWGWDTFEYTVKDERGGEAVGQAHVLVRPTLALLSEMSTGMGGTTIDGEAPGDHAGIGVAGGGDVNGDGLPDIVLGAEGVDAQGDNAGRIYVVFGRQAMERVSLRQLSDAEAGFVIDVAGAGARVGRAVDIAGDVNGDGLGDIVVGVPEDGSDGDKAGVAFVVFGRSEMSTVTRADLEAGNGGFVIRGFAPGDEAGRRVSEAGDVNGDGLGDVIIGAPMADTANGENAGRAIVVLGRTNAAAVDVSASDGVIAIDGEVALDRAGIDVSKAGDFNGDGYADVVVGAEGATHDGNNNAGRAYVVFGGKKLSGSVSLVDVAAGNGGIAISGEGVEDLLGGRVAGGGDLNADGFADIAIGAIGVDAVATYAGRVYVVYGSAEPTSLLAAQLIDGRGGFTLDGEGADDRAGGAVAIVPDTNGDGFDDLLIGAWASYNGHSSGRTYLLYGSDALQTTNLATVAQGTGGFALEGEGAEDFSSLSLDGAGDIDGDGLQDFVIGAWGNNNDNGGSAGRGYVVYGLPQYIACPGEEMCTPDGDAAVCLGNDEMMPSSERVCG